ncbi:hypothetical protein KSB_37750 [Ktedonobacter robiniae]|uniref:FAD dependent oxidoreductase domain-containing protein n=2 Tax=Ktedonobacter robiniae TaxID=2778365 RepID=A0ABQ3USF0_9CHLR|nr:hypothetical protein KSB_37750 [Ktedonobacter robiniae]
MYWLTGDEAREQEPLLDPHIQAAIHTPEESQVKAPQVVQAYYQAAKRLGAIFYPHEEVIGFQHHDSQVTEVVTASQSISCKYLIITAGSWAAQCGEWLNLNIPVTPLKGEIISYCQPTHQLRHIIFGEGAYLAPKGESIIVGATKADTGFDTQVTEKGIAWLQNATAKLIPSLAQSTFTSSWAGLRPKTPDTRPILGPAPQWKNVILATGHNSVGIILSAITGKITTEIIVKNHMSQIIKPFTLQRFNEKSS